MLSVYTGFSKRPQIHHTHVLSHMKSASYKLELPNITEGAHVWETEALFVLYDDVEIWAEVFKAECLQMNPPNFPSVLSKVVRKG